MNQQRAASAPSSSASVLKPNVQHAPFAVNTNAARQLQIEARFERFRRQSPTPKNLLARLAPGQFARPSDLPKPCQILDPVQSASEQLNTSTPVASPAAAIAPAQIGIRHPVQIRTPNLKSSGHHPQLPPLSAGRTAIAKSKISLESVILQRQRNREESFAATKVAAMVLDQSRSENSPFSSAPISTANASLPSLYSVPKTPLSFGSISPNMSPLLASDTTPVSPNWLSPKPTPNEGNPNPPVLPVDDQPIALRSPLATSRRPSPGLQSMSPKATVSSPAISFNEPQLVSPIPQGSPIMDIPSDPEFVPDRFPETPEPASTQHLLPTGRTSASRVVHAMRLASDSVPNANLQALLDMMSPKTDHNETMSSSLPAMSSALQDLGRNGPGQNNSESKFKPTNLSSISQKADVLPGHDNTTPLKSDNSQNEMKSDSQAQLNIDSVNCLNINGHDTTSLDAQRDSPVDKCSKSDPISEAQTPTEIGKMTVPDAFDALNGPNAALSKDTAALAMHNAIIDGDRKGNPVAPSRDASSKPQSAQHSVTSPHSADADYSLDKHPGCSSSGSAPKTPRIESSPASKIKNDDISRQIITPKRSISLRKSSSPGPTPKRQRVKGKDSLNVQESRSSHKLHELHSSASTDRMPLPPREAKINSPVDSVRSVDGSSSARSISGLCQSSRRTKEEEIGNYICLNKWYIEWRGKSPFICGMDSKRQQNMGDEIVRRNDQSLIVIAGDRRVLLGAMDSDTMQNAFGDEISQSFVSGFPENWMDVINSCESDQQAISDGHDKALKIEPSNVISGTNSKRAMRHQGNPGPSKSNSFKKRSDKRISNVNSQSTPGSESSKVANNRKARSARATRANSDETVKSDKSTVADSTITKDSKKHTPRARKKHKREPCTVPRDRTKDFLQGEANMLLEMPLDSVEGVTFSHSGRRRVQPLKFWLTERIIPESGTICTVAGAESPPAKRPRKRATAPKSKAGFAKRPRKQSRR